VTRDENLVMAFPIKKRICTELFIDKRAVLFIQKGVRKIRSKLNRVKSRAPKNSKR